MTYRPTTRVLAVLELLQSGGSMSGPELARRLEVNIRTVRDYIEMLQVMGIPVVATRGRNGSYSLRRGYKLPPLMFTTEEAQALTLSMMMGQQMGLVLTEPAFNTALGKIERVLPEPTRLRVKAISQSLIFESIRLATPPNTDFVAILSVGSTEQRSVYLAYQSAAGTVTERDFDPYGVVYHESFWYTVGFCHVRQNLRLFRLDRIAGLTLLKNTFIRPENFDTLPVVQKMLALVPNVWKIEVWFEASLDELRHLLPVSKAFFEQTENGVILKGEVEDLDWVARIVAGFGKPFIIRHPVQLKTAMREYALKLVEFASRD